MPQEASRTDVAILFAVFGGFAALVVIAIAWEAPSRVIGAGLVVLGVMAMVFSRRLVNAKISVGERFPFLWPGRNVLRPTTMVIWGGGIALLGVLQLLGL
jgi:hypothetical protein